MIPYVPPAGHHPSGPSYAKYDFMVNNVYWEDSLIGMRKSQIWGDERKIEKLKKSARAHAGQIKRLKNSFWSKIFKKSYSGEIDQHKKAIREIKKKIAKLEDDIKFAEKMNKYDEERVEQRIKDKEAPRESWGKITVIG